ncbi:MAG: hypothetical protein RDV00_06835 [Clostridia bacterium]|nr:hypothetical protein [Clostridia bacterium]
MRQTINSEAVPGKQVALDIPVTVEIPGESPGCRASGTGQRD